MSAPCAIRSATISLEPRSAAKCSGVQPSSSRKLTSAVCSIAATFSVSPCVAQSCRVSGSGMSSPARELVTGPPMASPFFSPKSSQPGAASVSTSAYSIIASSASMSPTAFHASHLARPLKSSIPGLGVLHRPSVAALYSPYSRSLAASGRAPTCAATYFCAASKVSSASPQSASSSRSATCRLSATSSLDGAGAAMATTSRPLLRVLP
mmetsp:Transcript_37240/g.93601  ORF Transcript_37240/g.93601 Transcript_37240/m.93601 type:complete len:209 (+) Transcript_37240:254-880(+)